VKSLAIETFLKSNYALVITGVVPCQTAGIIDFFDGEFEVLRFKKQPTKRVIEELRIVIHEAFCHDFLRQKYTPKRVFDSHSSPWPSVHG
jgi:hypothetical protein